MSIKMYCYGVRDVEINFFHKLNRYNYELQLIEKNLNDQNIHDINEADAVMVRGNCNVSRDNLIKLMDKGVKYILTRTVGFNHIDLDAAKEFGLKVARVPSYSPNAISELAVTLAMMLLRNTAYTVDNTKKRNFVVTPSMFSKEIRNCTVGVLGVGKIGFTTASLFHGLGAKVVGYDPYPNELAKSKVSFMELDDVLKISDIISVHLPYIKGQNYHLIDDAFISKMKDGAILINTARGELHSNQAVLNAILSGKLAGFGTDVLEDEASIFFINHQNQPIVDNTVETLVNQYPKVLVTPHIGSYTDEALTNMIETSYNNMNEFITTFGCSNQI